MAFFGIGLDNPYAAAEQNAQDRQTAFQGIKDNLPALGLVMGLSMLARNNGTRSVGQLIGQGGADALNAYGTWQKIQEAKARQEKEDQWKLDERDYNRSQDAFKNSMAEKQFGLNAMKTQQELAMQRARLGLAQAQHALARQNALAGNWELAGNGMIINKKTGELRPLSEEQKKLLGDGVVSPYDAELAKEFAKKQGLKASDDYDLFQKEGRDAASSMAKLDVLEDANKKIYTGKGGEVVQSLRQFGASLGLTSPEDAAAGEVMKQITAQMTVQGKELVGGMPGSLSDKDMAILQSMQPSLSNTPEGNRLIIDSYRKIYKRKMDYARMAREYVSKKGYLDNGFYQQMQDYAEKNPLFGGLGAPKAAQGAGAGLPSDIRWTK